MLRNRTSKITRDKNLTEKDLIHIQHMYSSHDINWTNLDLDLTDNSSLDNDNTSLVDKDDNSQEDDLELCDCLGTHCLTFKRLIVLSNVSQLFKASTCPNSIDLGTPFQTFN